MNTLDAPDIQPAVKLNASPGKSVIAPALRDEHDDIFEGFRERYRESLEHRMDGAYYALAVLSGLAVIMGTLAWMIPEYHMYFLWLFPAYFLFCNFLEYVLHRYPMHHRTRGFEIVYEHVTIHHNFYANSKFYFEKSVDYYAAILPYYILFGLTAVIASVSGVIYWASDLSNALFFALVAYGYYLTYELMHFSYHMPETSWVKKLPFVKRLARQHIEHHQTHLMTHCNFNITFPVFDWVFRTTAPNSTET